MTLYLKKYCYLTFLVITLLGCASSRNYESGGTMWNPISDSLADSVKVIELKKSSFASIFPASYEIPYQTLTGKKRFTPSIELIKEVEPKISNQFKSAFIEAVENQVNDPSIYGRTLSKEEKKEELKQHMKWINDLEKKYPKLYRQYIGYYSNSKEKILIIKFIDFSQDPHNWKTHFRESWVMGWHGWYYSNINMLSYNVDKNKLRQY